MFCQLTKDRPYRVKSVTTTMKPVRTIIWNNFMTRVMKTDTTEMKPAYISTQESLQQSLLQGHNSLSLGVGERRTGKRGGGRQQGWEPEGHQEGRDIDMTYREGA